MPGILYISWSGDGSTEEAMESVERECSVGRMKRRREGRE
jgi:hypothetical protein